MTRGPVRHRYRGWDGAQTYAPIRPEALLDQIGARFLDQDAAQVMNDILHRGLTPDGGQQLPGLDDLRGAIRERLGDVDLDTIEPSTAAGAGDLSDEAARLLRKCIANPLQAGRLLAGANPGYSGRVVRTS